VRWDGGRFTARMIGSVAVSGALAAGLLLAGASSATADPVVDGTFNVSGIGANNQMVTGPDGNIWLTLESATADLAKITPDGTVTEYDPAAVNNPVGITVGSDGDLWVTQAGGVAQFSPSDPDSAVAAGIADVVDPRGITAGPDNAVWTASGNKVIKIPVANPATFTSFATTGVVGARAVAHGGDGNIWVADFGGSQVVAVTPAGVGTGYATGGGPQGVAAGPGEQIGYTNQGTVPHTVGRIAPGGSPLPTDVPLADPFGMALGPDGAYWIANFATDTVGRLTSQGDYSTLTGLAAASGPRQVTAGPGNTVWVTLETINQVARITGVVAPMPPDPDEPPAPGATKPGEVIKLKVEKYRKKAKLFWKAPSTDGGAAIGNYQTKIKKNGDWRKWKSIPPEVNAKGKIKKVYKKLKPDKKYRVKVRAVNGVGSGPVVKKNFRTKAKS
jgi:streptogramin lyase